MLGSEAVPIVTIVELLGGLVTFFQELNFVLVPVAPLLLLFLGLLDLLLRETFIIFCLFALLLRGWHALISALKGKACLLSIIEI